VLLYQALTLTQDASGAVVLVTGYQEWPCVGWPLAAAYLVFALVQLYVLTPLDVCPGCAYRAVPEGRCMAGLSVLSAKLAPTAGASAGFAQRRAGALCHTTLAVAAALAPPILVVPALVLAFSWTTLGVALGILFCAALRAEVVFRRLGCPRCLARRWCPVARALRLA
jgi:hypothetical protein